MRACNFCGCKFEEKMANCPNCGSTDFVHVCPNCKNLFEGAYCTECGVRFDEPARTCPNCGTVYYTDDCPTCGKAMFEAKTQAKAQANPGPGISGQDPASQAGKGNMPILAIIFSALGMMTCTFPFSLVGLVLAIRSENHGTKNKLTLTAKVVAFVGMLFSLLFWIAVINNNS